MQMQLSTETQDSATTFKSLPLLSSLMEILRTETRLLVEGLKWLLVEGL